MNSHGITVGSWVKPINDYRMQGKVTGISNQNIYVQWSPDAEPRVHHAKDLRMTEPAPIAVTIPTPKMVVGDRVATREAPGISIGKIAKVYVFSEFPMIEVKLNNGTNQLFKYSDLIVFDERSAEDHMTDDITHEEAVELARHSMRPAREPVREPREKIMYLTCQHGINTASTHSLYPIRTPFQSAVYYSPAAYQVLPEEPVRQLIQECKGNLVISTALQNGTFKVLSRQMGGRHYLHVPPMLIKIEEADLHKPLFTALEGVWRVVFTNNIVTSITRLLNQREWLATAFDNNTDTVRTQSYILHTLEKIVREQGDDPATVSVGMLVCHDQTAYSGRIADLSRNRSYANAAEEPVLLPKEALFSSSEQIIPTDQLSLTLWSVPGFDPSTTSAWTALARQRIVGCGMNVLAYYGIIEESEARCRVSALPIQGQSIFSLYTMFHDIKITEPTKFVVVRVPLENSDEIFHELQQIPEDVVTFVKLYADTIRKGEDSHVGHTISFIKHKGIVYLVDPQASGNVPIGSGAALRYYTRDLYLDKNFIDMVFIERPIIVGNRTIYSVDEFRGRVGALGGRILSMNGLHWGGKRTRRVRRKKNKKTRVK